VRGADIGPIVRQRSTDYAARTTSIDRRTTPLYHDPILPNDGLAALRAYIEREAARLDDLQPAAQLRLRSAMTLQVRLDLCIEARWALDAGMFSPADIVTLNEIAVQSPRDHRALVSLAQAIEEQVRRPQRH